LFLPVAPSFCPVHQVSKMAPKKKNAGKKANDDWEADLGESIAPAGAAAPATDGAGDDEPSTGGGGLMNLMRKNKEKRKKKGLTEEFDEHEAAPDAEESVAPTTDLTVKAAVEANIDDEFALPDKKGKGRQAAAQSAAAPASTAGGDDDHDGSGRVLTKAEKEKLKKEREKQRKKEQV